MNIENKLLIGDCRHVLPTLPDKSVNCCVTSPPYYGLRDYGHADQIGLEETPEMYIETMVQVFREVRRVLMDDGTLWVNIGDSYWGGKGQSGQAWSTNNQDRDTLQKHYHQIAGTKEVRPTDRKHETIKPKDLIGIPWMLAFALRADGWYLRQDIIWHKPNPMPESVTDRCTKAHEYIFLLSKSPRYYYDAEAITDPIKESSIERAKYGWNGRIGDEKQVGARSGSGFKKLKNGAKMSELYGETRNRRSVWTVTTSPYSGAHFAVFPPKLIEPCILAGCPEGGTVLDPFGGSGTTAQVANTNRRNAITIELNPEYLNLQKKRVNGNQIKLI